MSIPPAGDYVMPFGKYRGQTLNQIAQSDDGLMYLDWAIGEFDDGYVKAAIERYLDDDDLSHDIEAILEEQGAGEGG